MSAADDLGWLWQSPLFTKTLSGVRPRGAAGLDRDGEPNKEPLSAKPNPREDRPFVPNRWGEHD